MWARSSLVAFALLAAACERPEVRLICHNANCVEPVSPEDDDTLAALERSLALDHAGRPAIDGIEIDSFWRASDGACLFAHDLATERTESIQQAADTIAASFARTGAMTFSGQPFRVMHELKSHVSVDELDLHTPEQLVLHATCAWQVYTTIAEAAVLHGRPAELVFSAFNPALLRALIDSTPASTPIPYRFAAVYGIPKPLDGQTRPLSDYAGLPISIIEMHAQWIHDAQHEGVLSEDVELVLWMFSATTETFGAIEQYEPAAVVTSEARLMRRWLER